MSRILKKRKKRVSSARCLMNLLFPQKRSKYLSAVWAIMRSNSAKHVPVGHSKQRNKGQDIVSVNEANFKGSSEAFSECFTEPRCFSSHRKSSLTKGGKTVKNTLKSHPHKGTIKKSKFGAKFLPYSVYKRLSWEYKGLMKDYLTLWTHPLCHVRPSKTKLLSLRLIRYCT